MRRLEQRILWAHGTGFIVRKVGGAHSYGKQKWMSVNGLRTGSMHILIATAPPGYVIFAPCGRYLARVKRDQLRRWLNHYGLENLR